MKMVWATGTWNFRFLFVNGGVWMRGGRVMLRMLCADGKWYVLGVCISMVAYLSCFFTLDVFYIVVCSEARVGGC